MNVSRDAAVWWVGIAGAVVTLLSEQFGLLQAAFPALGPTWQARISLIAALVGIVSGYLRMSPLPLSAGSALAGQGADPSKTLTALGGERKP